MMVLQEVGVLFLRMASYLVNALPKLGILVWQEISLNTGVSYLPVLAAVSRLIYTACRDGDLDIIWILAVSYDRVQAKAAKSRCPFLAMGMFPKA